MSQTDTKQQAHKQNPLQSVLSNGMVRYIGKRILQAIPVFIFATLLIYAMVFLLPGDPVAALFGNKPVNPQVAAQIRADYHLDQPFIVQYLLFLKGVVTFDFGTTLYGGRPVVDVLTQAFPVTVKLALMALLFEAVFGVIAGVYAGLRKGKFFDYTLLVASLVILAVPTFVMGFVLQYSLGIKLSLLPPTVSSAASFRELLMPAIVLGAVSFCYVLRLTRTSISENLTADHVRTARAKGLSNRRVVSVHVLRNSLIPVVTFLGSDLGALMTGAIVTEGVFNIKGIGRTVYDAVIRGDSLLVVSTVTVMVMVYMLANLLVDILYAVLDPRIRYA